MPEPPSLPGPAVGTLPSARALHPPPCPLPSSTLARQLVEGRVLAALRKCPDPDVSPHAALCPLPPSSQGRAGVSAPRRSENLQASRRESEAPRGPTAWPRFLLTLRRSSHPPRQELVPSNQPAQPGPRWASLTSVLRSRGARVQVGAVGLGSPLVHGSSRFLRQVQLSCINFPIC